MPVIEAPLEKLNLINNNSSFISHTLDLDILSFFGVFILKSCLQRELIKKYLDQYRRELNEKIINEQAYHITSVSIPANSFLRNIVSEDDFIAIAKNFFNGRVGCDFIRIVRKDIDHKAKLFLHQDTGYQIGSFNRYSIFIPLTRCHYDNGGIILYPGTHNFGYLGDVGEIGRILPKDYPVIKSEVDPGDIIIMHSAVWHESSENLTLQDRIYLEVHIQDIDEASTVINICGERASSWKISVSTEDLFINSRTQRLKKLYEELNKLKATQKI